MMVVIVFLSLFYWIYVYEFVMYIIVCNFLFIWRFGGWGGGGYIYMKFYYGGLYNYDIF